MRIEEKEENSKYPRYKLHNPKSPIIEMWTYQYKHFKENATSPLFSPEFKINTACAGLNIINWCSIDDPYIYTVLILVQMAAVLKQINAPSYEKHKKFEYAIINYEDLKKYEELHPEKPSVINNPTLQGISKRKLKKRVNYVQTL